MVCLGQNERLQSIPTKQDGRVDGLLCARKILKFLEDVQIEANAMRVRQAAESEVGCDLHTHSAKGMLVHSCRHKPQLQIE